MTLKTILIGYLPTPWSKAIALTTIGLSGTMSLLLLKIALSESTTSKNQTLSFLTIGILSILLIGTFICLTLTVVAYHKQAVKFKNDIEKQKQKPDSKELYNRIREAAPKPIDPKAGY